MKVSSAIILAGALLINCSLSLQNQINKKEKLNFSEVGRIHNEILEDFFYCNNTERTAE